MRSAGNRSKFPAALADQFATNKTELFNLWLDSGKKWDQVELKVKRSVENRNKATKGWQAVQGKELRAKFSAEKFDKIVQTRKANGMYYEDEDFPGDDDESHLNIILSWFWDL